MGDHDFARCISFHINHNVKSATAMYALIDKIVTTFITLAMGYAFELFKNWVGKAKFCPQENPKTKQTGVLSADTNEISRWRRWAWWSEVLCAVLGVKLLWGVWSSGLNVTASDVLSIVLTCFAFVLVLMFTLMLYATAAAADLLQKLNDSQKRTTGDDANPEGSQ